MDLNRAIAALRKQLSDLERVLEAFERIAEERVKGQQQDDRKEADRKRAKHPRKDRK